MSEWTRVESVAEEGVPRHYDCRIAASGGRVLARDPAASPRATAAAAAAAAEPPASWQEEPPPPPHPPPPPPPPLQARAYPARAGRPHPPSPPLGPPHTPSPPLASLLCVGSRDPNPLLSLRLPLPGSFEIGRDEGCDETIGECAAISASHCKLHLRLGGGGDQPAGERAVEVWLEDRSTNGTFVGGARLGKGNTRRLVPGERFSLLHDGPYAFELRLGPPRPDSDPSEELRKLNLPDGGPGR